MKSSKVLVLVGLLSLLGLFIFLQVLAARRSSSAQVSTVASSGTGLSTFLSFADKLYPSQVTLKRSAVFSSEELRQTGAMLILSPEMDISTREGAILKKFVQDGGLLLLSFHQKSSWRALAQLRTALGITEEIEPFTEFENYKSNRATAPQGIPLFEGGEVYSFYSALTFTRKECRGGNFDCFVLHHRLGQGDVVLISGLPPLANGLLPFSGNQVFAANLIPTVGSVVIDEYRHFYSDKTLGDLLTKPSFIFPMLALLTGALGFFIFGYSEPARLADRSRREKVRPAFHDFSLNALRGILATSEGLAGAVALQEKSLVARFPSGAARIKQIMNQHTFNSPLELAAALLAEHRALLKERMGLSSGAAQANATSIRKDQSEKMI
jgi:hypothetical protein